MGDDGAHANTVRYRAGVMAEDHEVCATLDFMANCVLWAAGCGL